MSVSNPPPGMLGQASVSLAVGRTASPASPGSSEFIETDDGEDEDGFELALGEADEDWFEEEGALSLSFGESDEDASSEWEVADLQELIVHETTGQHGADGSDGRNDAIVMEGAVDGVGHLNGLFSRPKPSSSTGNAHLLPYGVIAVLLLLVGAFTFLFIVGVLALTWMSLPAAVEPEPAVVRPEPSRLEESKKKSADQILQELLDAEKEAPK